MGKEILYNEQFDLDLHIPIPRLRATISFRVSIHDTIGCAEVLCSLVCLVARSIGRST